MAKILARDLDGGYLDAHRAFEEDRATHGASPPLTPSLALVSMNPDEPKQAFRAWVVAQSVLVLVSLARYEDTHGRTLTFADLRTRFLTQAKFSEATFMFSYSIARLYRLETSGTGALSGEFAGQLDESTWLSVNSDFSKGDER